jgi:hypothetical protein
MTRVVLNIPDNKFKSFLKAVSGLGINSHIIPSKRLNKYFLRQKHIANSLKKISSSFILFDWEFYINELEYE